MLSDRQIESSQAPCSGLDCAAVGRLRSDDAFQDSLRAAVHDAIEAGYFTQASLARRIERERAWMSAFLKGSRRANLVDSERIRDAIAVAMSTATGVTPLVTPSADTGATPTSREEAAMPEGARGRLAHLMLALQPEFAAVIEDDLQDWIAERRLRARREGRTTPKAEGD